MYLVDALSVLLRRWYIVLGGVLVLVAGAAAVVAYVPTTYQSSGQMVLLLPPGASGTERPVNPYLNLQTGLTTAASLVAGAASTKDVEKEMKAQDARAEYAVSVVPGTGPLISVTAKDSDPMLATATRDAMMAWIDTELRRIQDEVDVPQAQYISATRASVSETAEALPGSKLRALAALGAVVGLLTLVMTFTFDRLLLRRASRRMAAESPSAASEEVPGADLASPVGQEPLGEAEPGDTRAPEGSAPAGLGARHGRRHGDGLVVEFHGRRNPSSGDDGFDGSHRRPSNGVAR